MSATKTLQPFILARKLRVRYLLLIDLLLALSAVGLAILLRLESVDAALTYLRDGGWTLLLIAPPIRLVIYYRFHLYNRFWRYAGVRELHSILLACALAPLIIALLNFGFLPALQLPYSKSGSVWLLEAICSTMLLAASRFMLRSLQQLKTKKPARPVTDVKPTLIVGAGDAGAMVINEILKDPTTDLKVVGFVDDDASKHHQVMMGVPVLGGRERIPHLVRQYDISQVIIAMPTAPGKVIRDVKSLCDRVNIIPRVVPSLHALVDGTITLGQLRPIDLEDLLRRDATRTDRAAVRNLIMGRKVLVTGGGGSIGSELCRQILLCEPAELIILGHGENSIFEIEQELRKRQESSRLTTKITTCIADIRVAQRIRTIFFHYRPDIVFHAAAHKHVPLMEANPAEAVTNNILGTQNILNAALATNLDHFVMISSDKAVNPTSVMGASKRGAEMLVLDAARRSGKCYGAVRFGNVLGSRGSAVLTFRQQIASGGPVTVTHPDVERFFMTIPEAVQLVLQAVVYGRGGEIFMLDMGEPVKILDLARDLIRLSGLKEGRDIDIEFTGLRPGEKLYEELFLPGEDYRTTGHPKLRVAVNAGRYVPRDLHEQILELSQAAQSDQPERILALLAKLIPEYAPALPPAIRVEPQPSPKLLHQPELALPHLNGKGSVVGEVGLP